MRLDILIFALLAGYIFFRLWRVLGMRVEVEKITVSVDDVVNLRQVQPEETETDNIKPMVEKLQHYEPSFDPDHFVYVAEKMLVKIVQAYASGDTETLKKFVSPPLCEAFEEKILERNKAQQKRHAEVLGVQGRITSIETPDEPKQKNEPARIFVTFESEQIIYTTELDGSSYDNPSHLPTKLSDQWTFVRMIGSESPIWYVESTASQKYRST